VIAKTIKQLRVRRDNNNTTIWNYKTCN
jgi:hypothetical protein